MDLDLVSLAVGVAGVAATVGAGIVAYRALRSAERVASAQRVFDQPHLDLRLFNQRGGTQRVFDLLAQIGRCRQFRFVPEHSLQSARQSARFRKPPRQAVGLQCAVQPHRPHSVRLNMAITDEDIEREIGGWMLAGFHGAIYTAVGVDISNP